MSKGRVDVPGVSFGGKVEVYAKAPNKSLTVIDVEPAGVMTQGFDGRTGWRNGSDTANGIERAALVDADFYREIKLKEQYMRIRLIGKVKEGGGYDRNITCGKTLLRMIDYLHNNPVRRGLLERACDWRWSSAAHYEGGESPLAIDPIPPAWLFE